jgi:hypothetical protein
MTMSTCPDRDSIHHHIYWIHHDGINHISLLSKDDGSFSMRCKSGIVVSVTLIFEAFEYVSFKVSFDYRMSTWKLCYFPCFTLVVDIVP